MKSATVIGPLKRICAASFSASGVMPFPPRLSWRRAAQIMIPAPTTIIGIESSMPSVSPPARKPIWMSG